jgi:tape measure domain-containing protein
MSSVLTVQANVKGDAKSIIAAFKAAGAEVKSFKATTGEADSTVKKATGGWGSMFKTAATAVGAAVAGVVAAGVGMASVFTGAALVTGAKRVIAIQDATTSMTTIMGSATASAELMAGVLETVRGTPFNLDQFATAAKNLVAFGADAKKVPGYLTAIGNAAAASGNGAEGVDMIVTALGQASAAGRLSTDTINSLSSQGVPALQILANSMGKTTKETQKLLSDGAIPAQEGIDMLTQGIMNGTDGAAGATVKFGGAMEALRQTFSGALGGMKAAVARFGAAAITPFLDLATSGLQASGTIIDMATVKVKELFTAAGASGPVAALKSTIDEFNASADQSGFILDKLKPAIDLAKGAWDGLLNIWGQIKEPVMTIAGLFTSDLLPAVMVIGPALAQASSELGISTWQIFVSALQLLAQVLAVIIPPLTQMTTAIAGNTEVVKAIVIAYTAWRGVVAVMAFAGLISGLVKSTAAIISKTAAWVANKAAMVASKAQTVALAAMYAGSFVASLARTTAGIVANTAAWVANKVQVVAAAGAAAVVKGAGMAAAIATTTVELAKSTAAWIAQKGAVAASAAAQAIVKAPMLASAAATGIATAAQWAFNSALLANPITWIIVGIVALIAAIVLLIANWDTVVSFLKGAWQGFMNWIQPALTAVGEFFSTVFGAIGSFLSSVWSGIVAFVTAYVTTLVTVIMTVVNTVVGWWNSAWSAVASVASSIWSGIVSFVTAYVTTVVSIVMTVVGAIVSWWSSTWAGISAVASAVWSGITSVVSGAISGVQSIISSVVSTIVGLWQSGWNNVRNAVSSAASAVNSIVSGLRSGVQGAISGVVGFFTSIPGQVQGALAGAGSWLVSTGRNIIEGLMSGIKSVAGNILGAVTGPIKDAISGAKGLLGIKSPSRVFMKIGNQVGEGLTIGVDQQAADIVDSMKSMSRTMTNAWTPPTLNAPNVAMSSSLAARLRSGMTMPTLPGYGAVSGGAYAGGASAGRTFHVTIDQKVYPSQKMDEKAIADKSASDLLWKLEGLNA